MSHKQNRILRSALGFVFLGIAPFLVAAEPTEFHVATNGNDENPGTAARPFVTLEHAAAHARWAKVLDRGVWLKGYWRVAV